MGSELGLVGETKGTDDKPAQKAKSDADNSDEEAEPLNDDGNTGSIVSEKEAELLDTVDDELEIPGLRDLTIEVLGRIQKPWKSGRELESGMVQLPQQESRKGASLM